MDYSREIRVSIGLPAYNRAGLLTRTVESILGQSFRDFELIIVDDGSEDDTEKVVQDFGDSRIRYIKHDANKGLMASRNTALRESRGKYIAFQDSDDWWHKDFLKESIAILENMPQKIGGVYSRIEKKYFNGKTMIFPGIGARRVEGNLLEQFLEGGYMVTLQALVMKKECLEKVGTFDEDFKVFGDAEFIVRFGEHFEFAFNPNTRAFLEVQKDSISRDKRRRLEARELLYIKHKDLFARYPRAHAQYADDLGTALAAVGDAKKALPYFKLAVRIRPWRVDFWLRRFLLRSRK